MFFNLLCFKISLQLSYQPQMSTYEVLYTLVCKNGLGHQNNKIVNNCNIKCFIFKNFQSFKKCKMKIFILDTCEQNQNEQTEL
jgi:hypothetical protein